LRLNLILFWGGLLALTSLAGCETTRHSRDRDYDYYGRPPPQQPYYYEPEESREGPRLSDMQKRALDNCIVLPTRQDRARCRATVMSTVR